MKRISVDPYATPTNGLADGNSTYYGYYTDNLNKTWDADYIFGCVCDSSWKVGVGSGERQQPEWFGADCSKRHCPSNDNPLTTTDETNCTGVVVPYNPHAVGLKGNLCQVDCANLGMCDYTTGTCNCFPGFYGSDCTMYDGRVYEPPPEVVVDKDDD